MQNLPVVQDRSVNQPNRKPDGRKVTNVQRRPFHSSITGRRRRNESLTLVPPTAQQRVAEGQEIAVNETCGRAVGSIRQPPDAQANPAPNNAVASATTNQQEKRAAPTCRLKTYRSDSENLKSCSRPACGRRLDRIRAVRREPPGRAAEECGVVVLVTAPRSGCWIGTFPPA
jgi:hypothetical protein